MRITVAAVILLVAFVSAPAQAQVKSPFASGLSFTQADVDAILAATKPFFAKWPPEVGAEQSWSNPASGLSGSARYEGKNQMNDRPCRQIRHIVLNEKTKKTYEFRIDHCQDEAGDWVVVAGAWMVN